MKMLRNLSLTAILLPLPAHSLDFTPDATRIVSDPSYLPLQNQIYGVSQYGYGLSNSNTSYNNPLLQSGNYNTKVQTSQIHQAFSYGLTDDISLSLSGNYEWERDNIKNTDNPHASSVIDRRNEGFTNPSFGATWRVLDQLQQQAFNWDVIASYTPNLVSSTSAYPAHSGHGSVGSGGQSGTLSTALSHTTRDFTVYGSFGVNFIGTANTQDQLGNTTLNSRLGYNLNLNTQTRLTDRFSVNAGLSEFFNSPQSYLYTNANGGTTNFTRNVNNVFQLNTALNLHVIPNRLVASFRYAHDFGGGNSLSYANPNQGNYFNNTTKEIDADWYYAEFRYVLN